MSKQTYIVQLTSSVATENATNEHSARLEAAEKMIEWLQRYLHGETDWADFQVHELTFPKGIQ